jgi:hypothetical protein
MAENFNANIYRDVLRKQESYVPNANFLPSSGWTLAQTGHQLVKKPSGEEQVGVGVGRVLDYRLACSPAGNYNSRFKDNSPLQKAKFAFTVGRPTEPAFQEDYDKMYSNLDKIQNSIGFANDRRNMLEPITKAIRFCSPMFEPRVRIQSSKLYNIYSLLHMDRKNHAVDLSVLWINC